MKYAEMDENGAKERKGKRVCERVCVREGVRVANKKN